MDAFALDCSSLILNNAPLNIVKHKTYKLTTVCKSMRDKPEYTV
jgi:hypothetical protein